MKKPSQPEVPKECLRFPVLYKQQQLECRGLLCNDRMLYEVNFTATKLYLTKATDRFGKEFWTPIPQDPKLDQLIAVLVSQIEKQIKESCATITEEALRGKNTPSLCSSKELLLF
jgi:hypothetical protein